MRHYYRREKEKNMCARHKFEMNKSSNQEADYLFSLVALCHIREAFNKHVDI